MSMSDGETPFAHHLSFVLYDQGIFDPSKTHTKLQWKNNAKINHLYGIMSQIFFVSLQRDIFVSDLTMAQDILCDSILSSTIIPRRLGKEDKKLGIKAEKVGYKVG